MKRTLLAAALLSLIVYAPARAQDAAKPAPPKTIVQLVRDALNAKDFERAELLAVDDMAKTKNSPISLEAFSWLGRDLVARKRFEEAMTYASRTYGMVEEQLKTRNLDDEPRLPIALGAAIEVQALATAGQGRRSEAVLFLRRELETFKTTSLVERINKNINVLSLEGTTALPITATEWLGSQKTSLAELKGRPVIVYLWAHWCPDCKKMGPVLETVMSKYRSTGLTLVAPTKLYGYVAQRKPASPAEEMPYLRANRDEFYPWMAAYPTPVSEDVFARYGVSTTPTVVLIARDGKVSTYHPGQLTLEQLEPLVQKIAGTPATSSQD